MNRISLSKSTADTSCTRDGGHLLLLVYYFNTRACSNIDGAFTLRFLNEIKNRIVLFF